MWLANTEAAQYYICNTAQVANLLEIATCHTHELSPKVSPWESMTEFLIQNELLGSKSTSTSKVTRFGIACPKDQCIHCYTRERSGGLKENSLVIVTKYPRYSSEDCAWGFRPSLYLHLNHGCLVTPGKVNNICTLLGFSSACFCIHLLSHLLCASLSYQHCHLWAVLYPLPFFYVHVLFPL